MKTFLAALALAFFASVASADTLWTYTGNAMNGIDLNPGADPTPQASCNCALDGTFTLDASGAPIAWSFTDGTHTLNQTDSVSNFFFGDPATGTWAFAFSDNTFTLASFANILLGDTLQSNDFAAVGEDIWSLNGGNPGTMTSGAVATPEPASLVLLCAGLLFIAFYHRRRVNVIV